MSPPIDPKDALRRELQSEVQRLLLECQGGKPVWMGLVRRFEERGPHRATLYRWIQDAERQVREHWAKHGTGPKPSARPEPEKSVAPQAPTAEARALVRVIPFVFEGFEVRVHDRHGNPWFVLVDVCRVLGIANPSDAASRLRANEKATLGQTEGVSRDNDPIIISEQGLYRLVMRSDKPEAVRFQDWVVGTVLPSIRKHGGYIVGQEASAVGQMTDEELLARAQLVSHRIIAGLTAENAKLGAKVERLEPQAKAAERITEVGKAMSIRETAKVLKVWERRLIALLIQIKWLCRNEVTGKLYGYASAVKDGYVTHREGLTRDENRTYFQPVITAKGRVRLAQIINQGNLGL